MKTIRDQVANKCIHFNGLINDKCEAGVLYEDVKLNEKPIKIPCLKDTVNRIY